MTGLLVTDYASSSGRGKHIHAPSGCQENIAEKAEKPQQIAMWAYYKLEYWGIIAKYARLSTQP
jgi:hypothetical protein